MSAQLPSGDLTSPNSYMNNTHMKFEHSLGSPAEQQQQPMLSYSSKMEHSMQEPNEMNQHFIAPAGGDDSGSMQPGLTPWASDAGAVPAITGFPVGSPGSPYGAVGSGGFGSGVQLPADSAASHGSTDLGRMTPGLPQFQEQQSFGGGSAAEEPMQMQDMQASSLPAVGAGSPARESPDLNAQGFGLMSSTASAAADRGVNGHPASRSASGSGAQQHNRASSSNQHYSGGRSSAAVAAAAAAGEGQQVFRSQYRGVSYDKKKRKWRVQIKVAALGKSGVSVGYFDTEDAAARAYDRAAIGLLGRQNCRTILNFPIEEYDNDSVPELVGKSREEVKATLKSERAKMPRRRLTNRRRTSRYLGVGSSNRKNQWQARILYHGKVTHLGYYRTEEEAARVYDKVSISLHGAGAQTNFPIDQYKHEVGSLQQKLSGLTREELQRALGVKPMDKSSRYRGVSKKKGRWEAKVMLNRKWAYREMFDTEMEAARAYDTAVWRLKPREARNYVNFKDSCPPDVAEVLKAADKDVQLELHPTGLPLTAKPLIDAGLLFDEEGHSIRAPNGMTRTVSIGDLISLGDSATHSASEPSAGNVSGSAGAQAAHSSGAVSGGAADAVAGAPEGAEAMAATFVGDAGPAAGRMVKSASYSALSGLEAGTVTSNMSNLMSSPPDPAAAAAAPVPASSLAALGRGIHGELTTHSMSHLGVPQQQQQQLSSSFDGSNFLPQQQQQYNQQHSGFTGGMPRVQSVPHLRSMDAGSPSLPPVANNSNRGGLQSFGSHPMQQQYTHQQQAGFGGHTSSMHYGGSKLEGTFWNTELSYQDQQQQQQQQYNGMRVSRSCGNLAFMAGNSSPTQLVSPAAAAAAPPQAATMLSSPGLGSPSSSLQGTYSGGAYDFAGENKPLMVRVGSEQHLISSNPTTTFKSGMSRIASESHLSNMVPVSPSGNQFIGPERGLFEIADYTAASMQHQQQQQQQPHQQQLHYGSVTYHQQQYQQQQQPQQAYHQQQQYGAAGGYGSRLVGGSFIQQPQQQMGLQAGPPGGFYPSAVPQQANPMTHPMGGMQGPAGGMGSGLNHSLNSQQPRSQRNSSSTLHRAHSCATLESIDETAVFRTYGLGHSNSVGAADMQGMMQGGSSTARPHSMPGGPVGPTFSMHTQQQPLQQQQLGGMAGSPSMYGTAGPSMVPSGQVPAQQSHAGHFRSQMPMSGQQGMMGPSMSAGPVYGQSPAAATSMLPNPAAAMTGAAAAEAFGASAAASAGVGYSVDSASAGSVPAGSAAAGGMKPWQESTDAWGPGPGSPLGNVQIGGEDLDVTMAFLTDGSPRRMTEADNLDMGLADFDSGLRLPSPPHSHGTSALLYDSAMQGGLDTADLGMRMVE